ncbi:MAG: Maf family protein [Candidatus Binatia bacterium]
MRRPLVLASASPRRRELLASLGCDFTVAPTAIDEEVVAGGAAPLDAALVVARAKAAAGRTARPDAVVLAADTVVVLDDRLLGKPVDVADARRMLGALRDRTHQVITGLCVVSPQGGGEDVVVTAVRMRAWTEAEVTGYLASGAPLDKAGAYGIQDEPFRPVASFVGCHCNVVGLPLWTTHRLLESAGVHPLRPPDVTRSLCAACPLRVPGAPSAPAG